MADPSSWKVESNAKLVLTVDRDLKELRAELVAKGVPMGRIKSYPPLTGPLCDGTDPKGNVSSWRSRARSPNGTDPCAGRNLRRPIALVGAT